MSVADSNNIFRSEEDDITSLILIDLTLFFCPAKKKGGSST